MSKVLVTGGAGFIGSNLCRRLLSEGHEVYCVDNFLTGSKKNIDPFLENHQFHFIEADVTKPLPEEIRAEYIFHLASPASPNHHSSISYHSLPMETMMVNTVGTHTMLTLAEKNNAHFLFTSTSEIYGDPLEHPQREDYNGNVSTTGPRSVYDEAKRFGETLTAYYGRKGLDTRIARIFNTYGPGMQKEDRRMVVDFINQALSGNPISVFGKGSQTRSLCYIDDMVEGLMRLMFYPQAKHEIINLGSTEEHTVLEYAQIIKKITESNSNIDMSEELPKHDPLKRRPDITKAKEILDWQPKVPLEEGLKKAIEYFKRVDS